LPVGLAELVDILGDADADTGLLVRRSSPVEVLLWARLDGTRVAASAVLGRRRGLPFSLLATKTGAECAGGLAAANELILPVSE
jgi:hypothetical protein